jgi:hypothetical protein
MKNRTGSTASGTACTSADGRLPGGGGSHQVHTVLEDEQSFNVTGLIEDLPHNTNYTFSALISRNTIPEDYGSWSAFHIYTYVLLHEGFDKENVITLLLTTVEMVDRINLM